MPEWWHRLPGAAEPVTAPPPCRYNYSHALSLPKPDPGADCALPGTHHVVILVPRRNDHGGLELQIVQHVSTCTQHTALLRDLWAGVTSWWWVAHPLGSECTGDVGDVGLPDVVVDITANECTHRGATTP